MQADVMSQLQVVCVWDIASVCASHFMQVVMHDYMQPPPPIHAYGWLYTAQGALKH